MPRCLMAVLLIVMPVASTNADVQEPFSNRRIIDGVKPTYAVVRLVDPNRTTGFGPVEVTIAERRHNQGSVEVQLAEWGGYHARRGSNALEVVKTIVDVRCGSIDVVVDSGGPLSRIIVPSVCLEEGDVTLGHFRVSRPPRKLLFGNSIRVVATLDAYGPFDGSWPSVMIHSMRGDLLHQIYLRQLFSDQEVACMLHVPHSEMAWIDEVEERIITATRAHSFSDEWIVNTISLTTGAVNRVAPEVIAKSMKKENAGALYDIITAAHMMNVPISSAELSSVLLDDELPESGRMMAAVMLASANALKDRAFVEEKFKCLERLVKDDGFDQEFGFFCSIGRETGYTRRCDEMLMYRSLLMFLPALVGDDASPFLWRMMEGRQSTLGILAYRAVARQGRAAVPEAVAMLGGEWTLQRRLAAARLLKMIGPLARDALPVLRNLARQGNASLRQAAEDAIEQIDRITIAGEPAPALLRRFTNSIGMDFRLIPSGEFMMGGSKSPEELSQYVVSDYALDERPPHHVRISEPFWIGVTEVTQAQYRRVTGYDPSETKAPFHPVEHVDWADAVEFCKRLSAMESREYRLPSEAEWEFACRAGTTTEWCCDNDAKDLDEYAWYLPGPTFTHPVAQKRPNRWGLHDVHGNVAEWCSDWAGLYTNAPCRDPTGPSTGTARVVRGGHVGGLAPISLRSASRQQYPASSRRSVLGFRVVLVDGPGVRDRSTTGTGAPGPGVHNSALKTDD